jgi:hypothetical protein
MLHVLPAVYQATAYLIAVTEKYRPAHYWHKSRGEHKTLGVPKKQGNGEYCV